MKAEHLAKEADRLKADATLNAALDAMRANAFEALATADADDKTAILRLQQTVAVINEFRDQLDTFIQDGRPEPERPGFA